MCVAQKDAQRTTRRSGLDLAVKVALEACHLLVDSMNMFLRGRFGCGLWVALGCAYKSQRHEPDLLAMW